MYPAEFPAILAAAYHDSGRHAEAIAAAEASLALKRDDLDPLLILAASCAALGRSEQARAAARQARALSPGFDLAEFAASQPYREQHHLQRLVEHLRDAGLGD